MPLVNTGRELIVSRLQPLEFFVGIGRGDPIWDTTQTETHTFAPDNTIQLNHPNAVNVTVTSTDGLTTYASGTDYAVAKTTGVITRIVGGAIPPEATVVVTYVTERPEVVGTETALIDPVGYRRAKSVQYVEPDPAGTIVFPNGTYTVVTGPTRYLYIDVELDYADGDGETIREFGLFTDLVPAGTVPAGQMWLPLTDVVDPGTLVMKTHIAAVTLSGSVKDKFPHLIVI